LRKILERCAAISGEYIEDNGGLYAVLTSDEMLESDARAERDDRRAAEGYVAASDARSFLALARQLPDMPGERDPVTRAYFRELDRERQTHVTPHSAGRRAAHGGTANAKPDVARLAKLLADVTGTAAAPVTTLVPSTTGPLLGRALAELRAEDPALHAERLEELGFLANVLIAGEPNAGRRFRPIEALETALDVCDEALAAELGAPHGSNDARLRAAVTLVRSRHLEELFRQGWYERHTRRKKR